MSFQRSLREIAIDMQTDKEASHFYSAPYDHHFGHLRNRPIKVLEIGIGGYADPSEGGASLRMWQEYFPQAEITGLDLYDKTGITGERIRVLKGDQSDPALLDEIGAFDGVTRTTTSVVLAIRVDRNA